MAFVILATPPARASEPQLALYPSESVVANMNDLFAVNASVDGETPIKFYLPTRDQAVYSRIGEALAAVLEEYPGCDRGDPEGVAYAVADKPTGHLIVFKFGSRRNAHECPGWSPVAVTSAGVKVELFPDEPWPMSLRRRSGSPLKSHP